MSNSNKKQSTGFISNAFGVAKKLSVTGIKVLNHLASDQASQRSDSTQAIQGTSVTQQQTAIVERHYLNPQQILRQHVPNVSRQLLGRHFQRVDHMANMIAPQLTDQVSDYLFDKINHWSSEWSSVDAVLDEAGAKNLEELTQDPERSNRLSRALAEQTKWLASLQGVVTGAAGSVGNAMDVPFSIALSLRTIYQVGRAYGFELNQAHEQEVVQYIFRQVNLGLIAEKQTLLLGLKALADMLHDHDLHQLQQLLGSSNDADALKKWLMKDQHSFKWQWLDRMPKFHLVRKLTPLAAAGVGGFYSWKLIEDTSHKAQMVFSGARQYLIQHQDSLLSPLGAYEASVRLLAKAGPLLTTMTQTEQKTMAMREDALETPEFAMQHDMIAKIAVQKKQAAPVFQEDAGEQVKQKVQQLAEQYVEPHASVEAQKTALPVVEDEPEQDVQENGKEQFIAVTEETTVSDTTVHKSSVAPKTAKKGP